MTGDEKGCKFREVVCHARFSKAKLRLLIPPTDNGEICASLTHDNGKFEVAHFDREDIADFLTTACLALKLTAEDGFVLASSSPSRRPSLGSTEKPSERR